MEGMQIWKRQKGLDHPSAAPPPLPGKAVRPFLCARQHPLPDTGYHVHLADTQAP